MKPKNTFSQDFDNFGEIESNVLTATQKSESNKLVKPYSVIRFSQNISAVIKFGYGACKSCSCKGFEKGAKDDGYCGNCRHAWSQHS